MNADARAELVELLTAAFESDYYNAEKGWPAPDGFQDGDAMLDHDSMRYQVDALLAHPDLLIKAMQGKQVGYLRPMTTSHERGVSQYRGDSPDRLVDPVWYFPALEDK